MEDPLLDGPLLGAFIVPNAPVQVNCFKAQSKDIMDYYLFQIKLILLQGRDAPDTHILFSVPVPYRT